MLYTCCYDFFWVKNVDSERRAPEPLGRGVGLLDLGDDGFAVVVNIKSGDESDRRRRRRVGIGGGVGGAVEDRIRGGEEGARAVGEGGDEAEQTWSVGGGPSGGADSGPEIGLGGEGA